MHRSLRKLYQSMVPDPSLESLQTRVSSLVEQAPNPFTIAIAGGGSTFLSTLASTSGASRLLLEGNLLYHRRAFENYIQKHTHRFCSAQSAGLLAEVAWNKAKKIDPQALGLACTSTLKSSHDGDSRAHLCLRNSSTNLALQINLGTSVERTRFQEDLLVAHSMVSMLEYASILQQQQMPRGLEQLSFVGLETPLQDPDEDTIYRGVSQWGDEYMVQVVQSLPTTVAEITDRILRRNQTSVMVIPRGEISYDLETTSTDNALVLPGSFNPIHDGHVQLAEACANAAGVSRILFELSITNADKPSLKEADLEYRLSKFLELRSLRKSSLSWGVILTNAPLFAEKVRVLDKGSSLAFGIGTDTFVRLIDPKYYNNSESEMLSSLTALDCTFVVGGRLDPKNPEHFVDGHDELTQLPATLRDKFTILTDFRVDMSSTEIRKRASSF